MKELKNINKRFPCKCKIINLDLLSIFLKYKDKQNCVEALLRDINSKFGCITEEDLVCITEHLDISEKKIKNIIELHDEFEIVPVKQHVIKVCRGVVCQLCGSDKILDAACEELKIIPGDITEDSKFKLEVVECVGLCEIAPVIAIDNTFYGKIDKSDTQALIAHEKQKTKQNL